MQLAAAALDELGVNTIDQFQRRYDDPAVEAAWRAVRGQRSGISWHYLRILAGVQDVKADRMICAFVEQVLGRAVGPAEARELVVAAHEQLRGDHPEVDLRTLDHAIWTHQRARTGSSRIR